MAFTVDDAIARTAEALSQRVKTTDQDVQAAVNRLDARALARLVEAINRDDKVAVGDIIIPIAKREASGRVKGRARAIWANGSMSVDEFGETFG